MSIIDSEGVPVFDPDGDYSGAAIGTVGGSTATATSTSAAATSSRRPLWPLALLALPLLAVGVYFVTQHGTPVEDTGEAAPIQMAARPISPNAGSVAVNSDAPAVKTPALKSSAVTAATKPSKAPSTPKETASFSKSPSAARPITLKNIPTIRNAQGQMLGMRRALEADGWTVHWLSAQHEARAWKALSADRKLWAEMRVTPQGQTATSFRKGTQGKILKRVEVPLRSRPMVKSGRVLVPSPLLQRATDGRLKVGDGGTLVLAPAAIKNP